MSITNLPLGTDALIMGAHLYVNGKLLLATFPDRMIAPNAPACPAGRSHGRGPPLEARDEHDGAFADRKSGVEGKSVSVRVDPGGRRIIKKKKKKKETIDTTDEQTKNMKQKNV